MVVALSAGNSVQKALDELFAWIPKLIGAAIILLVAYLIAKAVGAVVDRVLQSAGANTVLEKGRAGEYKQRFAPGLRPSGLIGKVVFWFIFALGVMAAVSALGVAALSDFVARMVAYLPNVVAAVLIVLVATAIAGAVGGFAKTVLGETMMARVVQVVVPTLVMTIAMFMALVQLKIATQIVIATYVLTLGAIALGFALAFGLGGREVAGTMLMSAYQAGQAAAPQIKQDAQEAKENAAHQADELKRKAAPDAATAHDVERLGAATTVHLPDEPH